jgi:hypothetical protein
MPNWAVVIGIDQYVAPSLSLKGAVRDALAMTAFLTQGDPPLVEPSRLLLLLSPAPGSPAAPAGVPVRGATRADIREAIEDVARKPAGRLFVHFSGHGVMAPGVAGGEAILPANFDGDPGLAIRLDGIREFLRTSKFDEQFFFIDACRNAPLPDTSNIGQFPVTPRPDAMRPQVQQFVFCATLRGVTAHEDHRTPNDERGVFTAPLLQGLQGAGRAKIYDEDGRQYVVTTGRLLRYVRQEVGRTVRALGLAAPGTTVVQEPRLLGEMGDTELPLVTIAPSVVEPVTLRFEVTPPAAAADAAVRVLGDEETAAGPPITSETALLLPPRDYRVVVQAAGFTPARSSWRADVYENTVLALELRPPSRFEAAEVTRSLEDTVVELSSSDPLTVIEVFDSSGRIVATARERVVIRGVEADLYRARLVTPEGVSVEKTLEVDPGEQIDERIEAPAAPVSLSRMASSFLVAPTAPNLRVIGVNRDGGRAIDSPARPLTGDEARPASVDRAGASAGTFALSLSIAAGSHELSVALPVLDGWRTVLLIDEIDDSARQMRAAVALVNGAASVELLERLEVAQRYLHAGLFRAAIAMSEEGADQPMSALVQAYALLRLTQMPAGTSGSTRQDYADRLFEAVHRLRATASTLSDTKLLEAEVALIRDDGSARARCEEALDRGVPLFAFGTLRLLTFVTRFEIEHSRRRLLERIASSRLQGWPWTAWWR